MRRYSDSRRRSNMSLMARVGLALFTGALLVSAFAITQHPQEAAQETLKPPTNLPNPYRLVPDWPTLPEGMTGPKGHKWGEVIRVNVAPDGNIWVFQRCFGDTPHGDATCLNRADSYPPILQFDPSGKLLTKIG